MNIQNSMFPYEKICDEISMYFNGCNCSFEERTIHLDENGYIATDTYFNSFSASKWKKYSVIDSISLEIEIEGACEINLCYAWIDDNNIIRRWGDNKHFFKKESFDRETLVLDFPQNKKATIAYFEVRTYNNKALVHAFNYITKAEITVQNVCLAIGICTYKREEFVYRSIDELIDNCLSKNKIELIVSDNGNTLDKEKYTKYGEISIYSNKNYGGSGGFTRCIIEAKKAYKYTHILLMDDDILFDCEAIQRTYKLLSLLKPEYKDATIGGGMLILGEKNIQFESGALYRHGVLSFTQKNVNLMTIRNVIRNESNREINYNAWCYCTIPISVASDDNLPLPIFIHMDDVEYGVRNKKPIITMNGISVWHPYGANQRSSHIVYYDVRNKLIAMAEFGGEDIREYAKRYINIFYKSIFNYDYYRTIMACKGVEDFCKGVDYFKKIDPEKLNSHLMSGNKKWVEADERIVKQVTSSKPPIVSRWSLLKTYFNVLPRKQVVYDCAISDADPNGANKVVIYNSETGKCCEYKKSMWEMITAKFACKRALRLIDKKMVDVSFEWKDRLFEITSINFWNDYLGLENERSE